MNDLESSEWFYGHLLELPVVDRWPDAVWLLAGSTRIGLWRSVVGIAGAQGGAHVHFALHLIELSTKGEQVLAKLDRALGEIDDEMLATLTASQREAFSDLLAQAVENIHADCAPPSDEGC